MHRLESLRHYLTTNKNNEKTGGEGVPPAMWCAEGAPTWGKIEKF